MSQFHSNLPAPAGGDFILYRTEDGRTRIEVRFSGETVWLSLNQMADLFQRDKSVISKHIKNVFEEGELAPEATVAKFATVQTEGGREVSREIEFYNLDVIIFATVQNKLHWAITGQTAAELIYASADATKIYMGLTTWKRAPGGKILKSDVTVAKNYLNEAHVKELNRIVSAYLDLAENRAERGILMKMTDWVEFLHSFLDLSNHPILQDKGKVSALEAKLKAEGEYEVYRQRQDADYISDFDREIKRIEGRKP
jgi:hypothetical protein